MTAPAPDSTPDSRSGTVTAFESIQLACGHWATAYPGDVRLGFASCAHCNVLNVQVIGFTARMQP